MNTSDQYFPHIPLIKYEKYLQASAEMLNGRWFAGRMVLVEYLNPKVKTRWTCTLEVGFGVLVCVTACGCMR